VTTVPSLPRGVRLHDDRVRGVPVLLGPERALILDEIGAAILAEVDGTRSIGAITDRLAARYMAPRDEIAGDVRAFLDDLRAQGLIDCKAMVPHG
jgi:pyrroloquinoline quinone biosynthesis protein D